MLTRFLIAVLLTLAGVSSASSLIEAVRSGDARSVQRFAANGADLNAPEGSNGWTPLLHAIHTNQPASISALLAAGADVNRAVHGVTPLMMAAGYGRTPIVRLLLQRGADARVADLDGETALDWAVTGMADLDHFTLFECQDETVRTLLNAPNSPRKITPRALHWGRLKGCRSMALISR